MAFKFESFGVWKRAIEFADKMLDVADNLPQKYQFSLGEQLRRAALSIPTNLAQGSGRDNVKEKKYFWWVRAEQPAALAAAHRSDNPVEWITSVSMLTEGWDVQNVFRVVPHEERAFNSKLLIAQVLGRGLRVPDAYKGERPVVTVFNHDAWPSRIKKLKLTAC